MNGSKVNIHELIDQTMEALTGLGLSKHTVWGCYSDHYLPIGRYFEKQMEIYYSDTIMAEYLHMLETRLANGEVGKQYFRIGRKATERLKEFHDTGKLEWSCRPKISKFKLSESFSRHLDEFMATQSFHPNTQEDVKWAVKRYLAYLTWEKHQSIDTITPKDISRFLYYCSQHFKPGTNRDIICYIKKFHTFLDETGRLSIPYKSILSFSVARETKIHKPITPDEVARTIAQIDVSTVMGKRDMAIFLLAVNTGMRAVDIINLKLRDIDWRKNTIYILQRKTGEALSLPLVESVGAAIKEYILNGRPQCESDYMFLRINRPYQKLGDGVGIRNIWEAYQKKAGIERAPFDGKGVHSLRRLLGRDMAIAGIPVTTIAQVFGHSGIGATTQYISLDGEHLKECALDFHGIEIEGGAWA